MVKQTAIWLYILSEYVRVGDLLRLTPLVCKLALFSELKMQRCIIDMNVNLNNSRVHL